MSFVFFSIDYLCNDLKYQCIFQYLPKGLFISNDMFMLSMVVFMFYVYCLNFIAFYKDDD